jgi:hypothetical protein
VPLLRRMRTAGECARVDTVRAGERGDAARRRSVAADP